MKSEFSLDEKFKLAREMRDKMTKAEHYLWCALSAKQLGYRFRSHPLIVGYIPDFYSASVRVAIEVDGSVHDKPEVAEHDQEKEKHLTERGICVLRFTNQEVLDYRNVVLGKIRAVCEARKTLKALLAKSREASSSSNRGCANVDAPSKVHRFNALSVFPSTGKLSDTLCSSEQISALNRALGELSKTHAMDNGIMGWDYQTLAQKKLAARRELLAWATARQLTLNMPSSLKKAVATEQEAIDLITRKGMTTA